MSLPALDTREAGPDCRPIMADTTFPRRARGDEDKAARRQTILESAASLFEEAGGELPSVDQVARRAGLAKGTVYLYFRAKEEIFLALLSEGLAQWMAGIEAMLSARDFGPGDIDALADAFVRDLRGRVFMLRLASQCHGTLEQQVDEEVVIAFKRTTYDGLQVLGQLVEMRLPGLQPGQGEPLLLQIYALVIGIFQISEPPRSVRSIMRRPEFAFLKRDFESTVRGGLVALLRPALDN